MATKSEYRASKRGNTIILHLTDEEIAQLREMCRAHQRSMEMHERRPTAQEIANMAWASFDQGVTEQYLDLEPFMGDEEEARGERV